MRSAGARCRAPPPAIASPPIEVASCITVLDIESMAAHGPGTTTAARDRTREFSRAAPGAARAPPESSLAPPVASLAPVAMSSPDTGTQCCDTGIESRDTEIQSRDTCGGLSRQRISVSRHQRCARVPLNSGPATAATTFAAVEFSRTLPRAGARATESGVRQPRSRIPRVQSTRAALESRRAGIRRRRRWPWGRRRPAQHRS